MKFNPSVHVRIDSADARAFKREILYGQISVLKLMQRINAIRAIRRQEIYFRRKISAAMRALNSSSGRFDSLMPEVDKKESVKIKQNVREAHRRKTIEEELRVIHNRLERL